LFAAADVLMNAVNSADGMKTRVAMHTGPHRLNGMRPREVFTCEEYIEAMAMLIRMGLLPRPELTGGEKRPFTREWTDGRGS
jgi:hypothetical protein